MIAGLGGFVASHIICCFVSTWGKVHGSCLRFHLCLVDLDENGEDMLIKSVDGMKMGGTAKGWQN